MLREFVELRHTIFTDECSDWQSALEKCVESLVADGCVKAEYARDIINNVVKNKNPGSNVFVYQSNYFIRINSNSRSLLKLMR